MSKSDQFALGLALEAAEGFRQAGMLLAPRTEHSERQSPLAGTILGDTITGAVNLSLALELYLKCLLMGLKVPYKKRHELHDLFDDLPKSVKETIRQLYEHLQKRVPPDSGDYTIKGLHASLNREKLLGGGYSTLDPNPDLRDLLESHANTFRRWRYVHELPDSLEFSYYYDFRSIIAAITAVQKHVHALAEHKDEFLKVGDKLAAV